MKEEGTGKEMGRNTGRGRRRGRERDKIGQKGKVDRGKGGWVGKREMWKGKKGLEDKEEWKGGRLEEGMEKECKVG